MATTKMQRKNAHRVANVVLASRRMESKSAPKNTHVCSTKACASWPPPFNSPLQVSAPAAGEG